MQTPDDPGENEVAGFDERGGAEGEGGGGEVDEEVAGGEGFILW